MIGAGVALVMWMGIFCGLNLVDNACDNKSGGRVKVGM